jgi:hypothetical protein
MQTTITMDNLTSVLFSKECGDTELVAMFDFTWAMERLYALAFKSGIKGSMNVDTWLLVVDGPDRDGALLHE